MCGARIIENTAEKNIDILRHIFIICENAINLNMLDELEFHN